MSSTTRRSGSRGMPQSFISRQNKTLEQEGDRIDSKLATLQQESLRLEQERAAFERERAALAATPQSPSATLLPLEALHLSGEAQSRAFVDPQVVAEYTERMSVDETSGQVVDPEGKTWTPVRVYEVDEASRAASGGARYWVADGFHRIAAARELGLAHFQAELAPGSARDAIRESLSANARHGLRRTRADKRRAVERALMDDEWRQWTDQRVCDLCAVSRAFVSQVRGELEREAKIPFEHALYSADGREYEREPPAPVSAVAAAPETPAPRSVKTEEAAPSALASSEWRALKRQKGSHEVLIAYPESAAHYEALCQHALSHDEVRRVIVPLMSGTAWMWRGPSLLDGLTEQGFSQPHVVSCPELSHKRFVCWTRHERGVDRFDEVVSKEVLRGERGAALLIGQALDRW